MFFSLPKGLSLIPLVGMRKISICFIHHGAASFPARNSSRTIIQHMTRHKHYPPPATPVHIKK